MQEESTRLVQDDMGQRSTVYCSAAQSTGSSYFSQSPASSSVILLYMKRPTIEVHAAVGCDNASAGGGNAVVDSYTALVYDLM